MFASAGKTEPPCRFIFSQTLADGRSFAGLLMIRPLGACSPQSLDHELARSRRYAPSFVGKRDRKHVMVQSLLGGFDPGLEPVALPFFGLTFTSVTQAACTNRTRR